jgi:hypothetical protein
MTEPKDGTIPALAGVVANPPPQIFRIDEFERALRRCLLELGSRDSVAVSLQDDGLPIHTTGEKLRVRRLAEASHRPPRLLRDKYILRMAAGTASLAKFGLEDIQKSGFLSVRITGLLASEASGDLPANKPDPLL